jgi:hypothetical protein
MAAPTPWHMRCAGCKERVRAPAANVPALTAAVIFSLVIMWPVITLARGGAWPAALAVFVAATAAFDFVVSLLIVNRVALTRR